MLTVRVYVPLKPAVNDPQGTVPGGLRSPGYAAVADACIGKYLAIRLAGDDPLMPRPPSPGCATVSSPTPSLRSADTP